MEIVRLMLKAWSVAIQVLPAAVPFANWTARYATRWNTLSFTIPKNLQPSDCFTPCHDVRHRKRTEQF